MLNISCFCDGITFPNGEATNNRIIMIGKSLQEQGIKFQVFVNSPGNKISENKEISGSIKDINFLHLNGSLATGLSKIKRYINYNLGLIRAFFIIRRLSKNSENRVYIYSQGSFFNVYISLICKIYKISTFQEVNEWNEEMQEKIFHEIVYKRFMFRWSNGAIVISDYISEQVRKYCLKENYKILRIPVMADPSDWIPTDESIGSNFLWCGLIHGYFKDVEFLIEALTIVRKQYSGFSLILCGKFSNEIEQRVKNIMASKGLPDDAVKLMGFVSDEELFSLCMTSTALLSPLWDDERSLARFPTKIASYLLSSRPVITCKIGEVGKLLADNCTAVFYKPSNSESLAEKMIYILENEDEARRIGANGKSIALQNFDYRLYTLKLHNFFS